MWILSFNFAIILGSLFPLFSSCTPQRQRLSRRPLDDCFLALVGNTQVNNPNDRMFLPSFKKLVVPLYIVMRFTWKHLNVHLQVVILDNNRSLSRITTWAFLKESNMAFTAALQVQVHDSGGLQRRQAGTAFADLLSAMEALPEAFLAGKSLIFITELRLLHLYMWVHSSPVMLGC